MSDRVLIVCRNLVRELVGFRDFYRVGVGDRCKSRHDGGLTGDCSVFGSVQSSASQGRLQIVVPKKKSRRDVDQPSLETRDID